MDSSVWLGHITLLPTALPGWMRRQQTTEISVWRLEWGRRHSSFFALSHCFKNVKTYFSTSVLTWHQHRSEFWRGKSEWLIPTFASDKPGSQGTHTLWFPIMEASIWSPSLAYVVQHFTFTSYVTVWITRFCVVQDGDTHLLCSSVSCTWDAPESTWKTSPKDSTLPQVPQTRAHCLWAHMLNT